MILTYLNLKVYASRFVIPVVVYVLSPHFAPYLVGANNRMNMKRKFYPLRTPNTNNNTNRRSVLSRYFPLRF